MVQGKNNTRGIRGTSSQTRQANKRLQTHRRSFSHSTQRKLARGLFGICQVSWNQFDCSSSSQAFCLQSEPSSRFNDLVQHFKIFFRDGKYYIWAKPFNSFNELVEYYRTTSISRSQQIFLKDMSEEGRLYQAAYDFQAEDENELTMRRGDIVRVTNTSDANWWMAENEQSGQCGIVPCQYLAPLN
jgi:hypothetical protein